MGNPVAKFALPSGRQVILTHLASGERLWEPLDAGHGLFALVRQRRGDSSSLEHYRGIRSEPMLFDAPDATALAAELNRRPARRRPRLNR
jgi:hypothetical protein